MMSIDALELGVAVSHMGLYSSILQVHEMVFGSWSGAMIGDCLMWLHSHECPHLKMKRFGYLMISE